MRALLFSQCCSEKDKKILSLEASIVELKRNKDTQSVLCQSLSTETQSLRQQLKDTMAQMQVTMKRLEMESEERGSSSAATTVSSPIVSTNQMYKYKQEIAQLQEDLAMRDAKLKEVIDMNTKWQTYNKQRDQHVQQLKRQLADQSSNQINEQQQKQLEETTNIFKRNLKISEDEKMRLESENQKLRQEVEKLTRETERLKEVQDKIHVYEAQIKVITDDFKQEREDRSREHERAEKFEQELSSVKAQYENLQRERMREFSDRREQALRNYELQYQQQMFGNSAGASRVNRNRNIGQQQSAFVPRGHHLQRYECDDAVEEGRSEDVVDQEDDDDDMLSCPKCGKKYPQDKHTDLLTHLDECET